MCQLDCLGLSAMFNVNQLHSVEVLQVGAVGHQLQHTLSIRLIGVG